MLGEIVVTSPHKEVTELVNVIGKELSLNITVFESALEDAVGLVKGVFSQDPHRYWVVMSRGATLKLLRQEVLSIPLISIDPTEYDIVLALDQARILGNQIGMLFANPEKLKVIKKISTILGLTVKVYVYTNWQEFYIQVEKARRDGINVLIGGGEKGASLAQERGMKHVSLLAGENTVRLALERAKDIMETTQWEKESAEQVNAIVSYSHEGIMAINEQNIFSVFNPVASKLFGLSEFEVVGRPLQDLIFRRSLVEMFEGPEKRLGYIHKTRDAALLVNKVPLAYRGSVKGTLVTFKEITKIQEEESKIRRELYAKGLVAKYTFSDIIHVSKKMEETIAKAKKFANADSTVLIRGESGTGKELMAQSIHNGHNVRCKKPFVAVNCASLDDNLLKSELFGYTEGSFTGASKGGKPGLFEIAHGGTIFLDEIGKIKLDLQANLLRVLQEKEVRRIGSDRVIPVDVRIIAASNENLEELIKNGTFREDLYYRLNVLTLSLPSLSERREDIPGLVSEMLKKFNEKYYNELLSIPSTLLKRMSIFDWPGNVRQLENLIERYVVLAENETDVLQVLLDLIDKEFGSIQENETEDLLLDDQICVNVGSLQEMENEIVHKLSVKLKLSKSQLALRLGISRPTLLKLLNSPLG